MAKLTVKDGVQPRLVRLVAAAARAAASLPDAEVVITAGIDGTHGSDSLHYALRAIDVRTHNLSPASRITLLANLKTELGPGHDVFIEDPDTDNEHIHAEFDPK